MSEPDTRELFTLFSFDTEYNADSVEWCPHDPNKNIFVCANYQLNESDINEEISTKRTGRILLFSLTPESGLKLHQAVNTAAVLDQKWCHNKIDNNSVLGIVNASNKIEVYKLNNDKIQLELITFFDVQNNECETLILSLDWSTGVFKSREPHIICSDSKGNVHLLQLVNDNLIHQNTWHGHEFEAWIAAFYYWDTNVFFSGGDDNVLLKFDSRVGNQAVAKNKSHQAGVTSLHSNGFKENILASGSYDEFIKLWDMRNMKNEIHSIKMPGPLWRLKWDPFCKSYLLAACMLGGVHIVQMKDLKDLDIIGSYYAHKSMSYGADWSYLNSDDCKRFCSDADAIIGTCSFYDNLLCISKLTLKSSA